MIPHLEKLKFDGDTVVEGWPQAVGERFKLEPIFTIQDLINYYWGKL